jgi:proline iminopeptidase
MRLLFLSICVFTSWVGFCQATPDVLDYQTFGKKTDPAIIFLHGGPGYNSVAFEVIAAEKLAGEGFFVLSYDRRGEGRHEHLDADYTLAQTQNDLLQIIDELALKEVNLLGHSFGGIVASQFASNHPEMVNAIILMGSPVVMQDIYRHVIAKSEAMYKAKGDETNLKYIDMLKQMDTTSLEYSAYSFMHAMSNGFYSPAEPQQEAKELYQHFMKDTLLSKYASRMGREAPAGFWKNDQYTTIDIREDILKVKSEGIQMYALYGEEDGLYPASQKSWLKQNLGKQQVVYLEDCSHSVFVDRRAAFLTVLSGWLGE